MTLEQFIKEMTNKKTTTEINPDMFSPAEFRKEVFSVAKTAVAHGYFDKQTETELLKSELSIIRTENNGMAKEYKELKTLVESQQKEIKLKNEVQNLTELHMVKKIDALWEDAQKDGITMTGTDFGRYLQRMGYRLFQ